MPGHTITLQCGLDADKGLCPPVLYTFVTENKTAKFLPFVENSCGKLNGIVVNPHIAFVQFVFMGTTIEIAEVSFSNCRVFFLRCVWRLFVRGRRPSRVDREGELRPGPSACRGHPRREPEEAPGVGVGTPAAGATFPGGSSPGPRGS